MVVHIIRPDLSVPEEVGKLCVDKYLSIRTIYPNGNVVPVDIKLDIQDFNYCILDNNIGMLNPIQIFPIRKNFLLVTYTNAIDESDPFSYTDRAMIIDLYGNIYSNITFGSSFVDVATNQWQPREGIFINFDPDKGFFRFTPTMHTDTIWQQYDNLSLISTVVSMVDGRYAIVFANSTDTTASLENPFIPRGGVYIYILDIHKTKREPAVLYQTPISGLKFVGIDCGASYVGFGQTCIVAGVFTIRSVNKKIHLKIDFLSSGTVINVLPLIDNIQRNPLIEEYFIEALRYGGYLLKGIGTDDSGGSFIEGYILNGEGIVYSWDLPMPTVINPLGIAQILRNNTIVISQPIEKPYWTLITTTLYKFEQAKDHGYENFHIEATTPNINDIIAPDTKSLTITYNNNVDFSVGRIKIFHENGNLRQIIIGNNEAFINQTEDGNLTTVYVKLIESTLNQPDSKYYVLIENNFVKNRVYQEPLYGIKENVWYFNTTRIEEEFSESANGQVRLNEVGTEYFKSLNENDRKTFFEKLSRELADAIPISHERVTTNERNETDASTPNNQIFLPIKILKDKISTRKERTVKFAIQDLDHLIRNKFITVIGSGETSQYLDEIYGYKQLPNQWQSFGPGLLGAFAAVLVLALLFMAKNTAIFQFGLAVSDIVLDWLFIFTKSKNVKLFIPSLVILLVSFFVSLILAFRIISKELRNDNEQATKFRKWLNENSKIVNVFNILAGTDLEILNVLDSKIIIFGIDKFNAGYSDETVYRIAYYSCVNIILEDIPQLVIQVIYFRRTLHYDIIPLLTLISSCLSILSKVVDKYYLFRSGKTKYDGKLSNERSNEKPDDKTYEEPNEKISLTSPVPASSSSTSSRTPAS
ncbi:3629_t:CDS:10 [Funneliformis mosseae]|uniref:3629_t:CDS:1 n=1 Tax=Funneliformis mosseae TaxID=27381 RepID=A0A9N8VPA7_FUNMO|nr:3629_t:CDS:10 [Funneliformis mosseae]